MANEILQKSRSRIIAQAASSLGADIDPNNPSYAGGSVTTLENTIGSTNCNGADFVQIELDITAPPTAAAACEIWWRGSEDGSNWSKWKYSHTVGDTIETTADRYDGGIFMLSYQYTQLKMKAVDYGYTAVLYATPKLTEVQ